MLSYDNLSTRPPMAISVKGTAPTVTLPDGTKAKPDIAGATAEWIDWPSYTLPAVASPAA